MYWVSILGYFWNILAVFLNISGRTALIIPKGRRSSKQNLSLGTSTDLIAPSWIRGFASTYVRHLTFFCTNTFSEAWASFLHNMRSPLGMKLGGELRPLGVNTHTCVRPCGGEQNYVLFGGANRGCSPLHTGKVHPRGSNFTPRGETKKPATCYLSYCFEHKQKLPILRPIAQIRHRVSAFVLG
jgi:hypothetical protein